MLETRKFVMAVLHWKQGLLCDKIGYHNSVNGKKLSNVSNYAKSSDMLLESCHKKKTFLLIHTKTTTFNDKKNSKSYKMSNITC